MRAQSLLMSLLLIIGITSPAFAGWVLDNDTSHLSFASEKKGNVGEVHHFRALQGRVSDEGAVTLSIDLSSLETWADIRNDRMLEHLFEVSRYPEATIAGTLNLSGLDELQTGARGLVDLHAQFTLHGISQPVDAELAVFRLTDKRVLVVAHELMILDATAYGLAEGIEKLRELAALPSISAAVPVGFYLVFDQE